MRKASKHELDRLLARGGLSGPDRDRIIANVRNRTTREGEGLRPFCRLAAVASAAAVVLALLFVAGWYVSRGRDEYRVKGAGAGVLIEIACRHGDRLVEGECAYGDRLLFRVSGLKQRVYLVAYADGPGGKRIWYFPQDNGNQPELQPSESPRLVDQIVLVGDEHDPGTYRITALLLEHRARREEVGFAEVVLKHVLEIEVKP